MRTAYFLLLFCVALTAASFSQATASQAASASKGTIDNNFVHSQFGDQFTLMSDVPPVVGDLDGDGVEDIVIAARCKNAMLDQGEHNFVVIDPYYEYFGYGDPKLTTTFSEGNPALRGLVVLIIHGAGPDAWRSPAPKAKYVVVNLPYKSIAVRKMHLKKKNIEAVYVEEAGEFGDTSALYFDGKKFKYSPMGGEMQ